VSATSSTRQIHAVVTCACGCLSTLRWSGWRAFVVDDPEELEEPGLVFLCPACAAREEYSRAS
jgi:hypothetical protein